VNTLIDTSVWSLVLRRKPEDLDAVERSVAAELSEVIQEGRGRIIAPVRQELLSGIKSLAQYEKLRLKLRSFPDEPVGISDYESAAKAGNDCRARGIVVSPVDILICAAAIARRWSIFTVDTDFKNYARVLPITFHSSRC
jgi:predicted nucleic acid-binding protein